MSEGGTSNAKGLKDLLNEFDSSNNIFQNWKQPIKLLWDTYSLDDNATKVLILESAKFKDKRGSAKALEHVALSVTNLLGDETNVRSSL